MAVVISAMAPSCTQSLSLHGSSRLSRASSRASTPPPPPALAKKHAQDTLFTDEEFHVLMSGQCELLSFSDNDLQSPSSSPLLSLQLQAQQLCREDDAYDRFQDQETPPPFDLDDELEAPISDEDVERLAPPLFCDEEMPALLCDEEIEVICAAPAPQQPSMQFSRPRSDDHQAAGKKRASSSSPPWPSCIADDDEWEEAGQPPPLALPIPPTPKKARTQTKRRARSAHGPPPLPPRPTKKARPHAKSRSSHEYEHRRLLDCHKTFVTRILTRQFRAPEISRGRTALRCQCPELELAGGLGCCALHQDALPEHREWMFSAHGHVPPLVGGPGQVLVPTTSTGGSRARVLQYVRWRRSVSLPTRFYVQHAVEKQRARSAAA